MAKKNILVIFTGGTFSMKIDDETGGAVPHFHGDELMNMIPEARELANIDIYNFGNYPGPHMT
ncbi:MAG: asparaginase domain-containing protein, partial [Melioribacteraceae bacterium]|nr:asparaginase domain-containing protein [Melioribacteraceae bacterium]